MNFFDLEFIDFVTSILSFVQNCTFVLDCRNFISSSHLTFEN